MKIKKSGKNISPEKQAVINAAIDNSQPINHTRNIHLSDTQKEHKFLDFRLGIHRHLMTHELIKLANQFREFIEKTNKPCLFQTFWLQHGITMKRLGGLCLAEPEFAELVEAGRELIGEKWGGALLGDLEHKADWTTLRQRAPVYIQEWKQHDKEMRVEVEQAKADLIEQQKKEDDKRSTFNVVMQDYGKKE